MRSQPDVLCFDSVVHKAMVSVAIVSFFVNVVPFTAAVFFATFRHKRELLAGRFRAHDHLIMFNFLFAKSRPERYYYASLATSKGCLICLAPIFAFRSPAAEVFMLAALLLAFAATQLQLQPWRSSMANFTDGVLSMSLVSLLLSAAMFTDFEGAGAAIGMTSTAIFSAAFGSGIAVFLITVYRSVFPVVLFRFFLCHHKAHAGGQARLVQLMLGRSAGGSCFLDSDRLCHLDDSLEIVRSSIGTLVVFLTTDTMRRPWCALEITTCYLSHQRVLSVRASSFVRPGLDEIRVDSIDRYLHACDIDFARAGATQPNIALAFEWFLSDDVRWLQIDSQSLGLRRYLGIVESILSATSSGTSMAVSEPVFEQVDFDLPLTDQMLIISPLLCNDESTALAGIVAMIVNPRMRGLTQGVAVLGSSANQSEQEQLDAVRKAYAVVVILTSGSLLCKQQQKVIAAVCDGGLHTVAIPVCTPDFQLPDGRFYQLLGIGQNNVELAECMREFFKQIAVPMSACWPVRVITAQCDDIIARLPRPDSHSQDVCITVAKSSNRDTGSLKTASKNARVTPVMADDFSMLSCSSSRSARSVS